MVTRNPEKTKIILACSIPTPGAMRLSCNFCNGYVYVSQSSVELVEKKPGILICCDKCTHHLEGKVSGFITPTEEQLIRDLGPKGAAIATANIPEVEARYRKLLKKRRK